MSNNQTPNEFYADRGLVRTSITLTPEAVDFVANKAKSLADDLTKVTQGEIVTVLLALLESNQAVQSEFNEAFDHFKLVKVQERNALRAKNKKVRQMMREGKLDHLIE